jgi:hypothetical protein
MGIEFLQHKTLDDYSHFYQLAKGGKLIKFYTGWVQNIPHFAPLPLDENVDRMLKIRFTKATPKRPNPEDKVPCNEANLLSAWIRFNQCCYYESLAWCFAALPKCRGDQLVDVLVLASNNAARLGLSIRVSQTLLGAAAKLALHSLSEWDVVLGLQTYCSSYGFFIEEEQYYLQTRHLPSFSTIRKRAFAVHVDSQIEHLENKLLGVMCQKEYHHFCYIPGQKHDPQSRACLQKWKSFKTLWSARAEIAKLRKVICKESQMIESNRSYWLGLLYILEGVTLALVKNNWKDKKARLLGEWGRVTLFNIRGRFSLHHKRSEELRILCVALQNSGGKFKVDSNLLNERFSILAHSEMSCVSHRSISFLLKIVLYFQLFEEGPFIMPTLRYLLEKAHQDVKMLSGKWYRAGLVKNLYQIVINTRNCIFRPLSRGIWDHRLETRERFWLRRQMARKLALPSMSDLINIDGQLLECLSVGYYSERLRITANRNLPGPDHPDESDSFDEFSDC